MAAGAVWVTAHGVTLPDDFVGLPRPDVAAIIAITLSWIAWSICECRPSWAPARAGGILTTHTAFHLVWIVVQEENPWITQGVDPESEVVQRPRSVPVSAPKPLRANPNVRLPPPQAPQTRRFGLPRGGRVSAHVVAVQHGTPPEMWDRNNAENLQRERELRAQQELERQRQQELQRQPSRPRNPFRDGAAPAFPMPEPAPTFPVPALNPIAPAFPVPEFEVQRVRLAPNPRARQLCSPPPVKTSTQQWYFTPGEAI